MPARTKAPVEISTTSADKNAALRALDYAKQIIQNYEADVKAGAWTGVNLEAVGFCQGETYKDALQTIDRILRGELVV